MEETDDPDGDDGDDTLIGNNDKNKLYGGSGDI